MLIKCDECQLQVSDKASACPHCGYPLQPNITKKPRKTNKRRRLPNGFGQISEIKGRSLRNPFRAMVTVGKNEYGRPICKPLKPVSFFPTYNEAYAALVKYNQNPYDLKTTLSVQEVYDEWTTKYFPTLTSRSSEQAIEAAWKYCSAIYDVPIREVRARHIRACIDDSYVVRKGENKYPSKNTKMKIKYTLNSLFKYAVAFEYTDRNYAKDVDMTYSLMGEPDDESTKHISFTEDEMKVLWDNVDTRLYVDAILIQCYSGWRPGELVTLKLENIDLDEWTMRGGIKTEAGIDRIVPVHEKIKGLVKKKYAEAVKLGSDYLVNCFDKRKDTDSDNFNYRRYLTRFENVVKDLNLNPEHRAHDPRVQFVTMAKRHNLDEYAIKRLVGHQIDDLTEKVYTERDVQWLRDEIAKIK